MTPAIRTSSLTKRYGESTVVSDLDLAIGRGEVFGLLGPNGAGKTTTILMLLGLIEPTSGEVEVVGLDPRRHPLDVKRRVGFLPDAVGFYDSMTGAENLRFTARLNGVTDADARIGQLLNQVGLSDAANQPAGQYSRGMKQRLGLADALLKSPEVLILDEPTTAIDPEGVAEILDLIRHLATEDSVTVLLSSHLLHQVQEVCDRVAIFVDGRVVAQGTPEDLAADHTGSSRVEFRFASAAVSPEGVLSAAPSLSEVTPGRSPLVWTATVDSGAISSTVREVANSGADLTGVRRLDDDLDAIYRRYFKNPGEVNP